MSSPAALNLDELCSPIPGPTPSGDSEHYSTVHDNGGNLMFLDGHAEYRLGNTLTSTDFGLIPTNHTWSNSFTLPYTPAF